nr:putative mitochondrial protein [Tanacetum cinerariifolium]
MDPNPITDLHPPPPPPSMTTFPQPITSVPSPPHPPYNEMIRSAIVGLKDKDGSSKQAISKYIEKEFGHTNLPPTHPVMLTHHLKRMRDEGQLVMVKHSYMLPPSAGSVAYNDNNVSNNNTNNTLDFSNPSGGASNVNVNGSSLGKRKPGRPAKVKPVPGLGVHNVQVLHDANVQQSYQPPFPFHQGVQGQGFQGQGAGFEGSNVGGGGGGGAEPLFVSLGLGDEGVAVQSAEKESTGVKRGRGRPAKKTGSVGRLAKKGGSVGRPAKKVGLDGLAATGENGGSEVEGVVSEAKEVAGGDEVKKVADGNDETEGEKRGRGRPRRKAKMISVPTGGNGRLPRARSRPVRLGSAPVTVPLAGNVLRPRGRPKRFGRPVVNGVSVRGSRRPPGRPSLNKVTNLTGLELARPAKFKIVQDAINSEAAAQRALLQETIEKNKVEADRQFAELMNAIKTQQPSTTTPPVTLPPPTRPMPTPIYSNFSGFTQPFMYQQPQHPTQTSAYTSFSGLHFDSQGFSLPMGSIGFGPFSTGEQGSNYNRGPPMSKEGAFPGLGDLSLGNSERVSSVNTRMTPPPLVHRNERGWGPGIDYRLRKLKMPLCNGDDVYEWVYQAERFFDIQALQTTGERLRAAMMCLVGPSLSWFRWSDNRKPFRSWEELKHRLLDGCSITGVTKEVPEGIFIKGLKQELRTAVGNQQPTGLGRTMELALVIDESRSGGVVETHKVATSTPTTRFTGGIARISNALTGDGSKDMEEEAGDEEQEHPHLDYVEVSVQSVVGITNPHTMKIRGNIHGFEVVVLIDSGATHNFLSVKLLDLLNLIVTGTRETRVILGNGKSEKSVGICRKGDMRVNWRELTMTFQFAGKQVTLNGDAGLHLHPDLDEILTEFLDVFSMPARLPPSRDHEHAIVLKQGTEPINVRPYRYPQLQKDEIETLVGEMIEAGIIRPSNSPYSSPVLLVKKKDESWRFCVDYRALNKSTVLDKFPIPVIDELLDELHRATGDGIQTHEGHYEFLVMPFGLTNAPSTFRSLGVSAVFAENCVQLDLPATNATEPAAEPDTVLGTRKIQQQFSSFHLEDKVVFQGEGDDMNRWGQVYKRMSRGEITNALKARQSPTTLPATIPRFEENSGQSLSGKEVKDNCFKGAHVTEVADECGGKNLPLTAAHLRIWIQKTVAHVSGFWNQRIAKTAQTRLGQGISHVYERRMCLPMGQENENDTWDGPGTAVLVTDPRQLVVYQELMSKYELLQSKVKQVAGVVKSCIDPTYGSTALGALQELEALAGGDANASSHVQT